MIAIPFLDAHTHNASADKSTVKVINRYPGEPIPEFEGWNYYSVGLHPWRLCESEENVIQLEMMQNILRIGHVIFTGECGLDKISQTDFAEQKRVFREQAIMAESYHKPLIIHCVKAYNEIVEIYQDIQPSVPWIFHGYTGSSEMTTQLAGKGFLFSFGKILFNDKARAVESFKNLPLSKILLESDEYDSHIKVLYKLAAGIRQIPLLKLKQVVWENFNQLKDFGS